MAQIIHQQRDALANRCRQIVGLLIGEKQDPVGQKLIEGGRIAQRAPDEVLKLLAYFLRQMGHQAGLADAAHAQYAYQTALIVNQPLPQLTGFELTAVKDAYIWCLTPVLP